MPVTKTTTPRPKPGLWHLRDRPIRLATQPPPRRQSPLGYRDRAGFLAGPLVGREGEPLRSGVSYSCISGGTVPGFSFSPIRFHSL
jgi:hypothetical protein